MNRVANSAAAAAAYQAALDNAGTYTLIPGLGNQSFVSEGGWVTDKVMYTQYNNVVIQLGVDNGTCSYDDSELQLLTQEIMNNL